MNYLHILIKNLNKKKMDSEPNNQQNAGGANNNEQNSMANEDPKGEKKMTQEELVKLHKEIEANANYVNELKLE